jgi:uncharacterized protein (TIGR01777 family)
MGIVIAGGTGFLGRPLATALGTDLVILSRQPGRPPNEPRARVIQWTPDGTAGPWASVVDGADAVINLAGESIAGARWTDARKRWILQSRLLATRSLVEAMAHAASPPPVFVSGSAVGYYGALGDEIVAEDRSPGADFLAGVCVQWEAEAMRAASPRTRVVCIRTGLVLERDGGALPKMLPPFWLGAGGPVGSGRQYWSWIHRKDWIDLVRFAIRTDQAAGALNATAPNPVTNADFARALGRSIGRPSFVPTPGIALKLLLGEMAEALLLSGQRVVPSRAERLGYAFAFPDLAGALRAIFTH